MKNGLLGITCKTLLLLTLSLPCLSEDLISPALTQTYGYQEVGPNLGGFAARKPVDATSFHFTVGAQLNGFSDHGTGIIWGVSAQALANDASNDWLVGGEFLVVSANANIRWSQSIHTVIGCRTYEMLIAGIPCVGANNIQSRAIRISSAEPGVTGFENGIHFDDRALMAMIGRPRPAALNFRDVSENNLQSICIIALPDKCITADMLRKLF